jgi:hypothetical protein
LIIERRAVCSDHAWVVCVACVDGCGVGFHRCSRK